MATAHYSKFMDTITESIFKKLHYPSKLKKILKKKECFLTIDNDINQLEKIIEGNK
jgi:threonine synthase